MPQFLHVGIRNNCIPLLIILIRKPTHQWGDTPDSAWTPVSKDEASGKKPMRYYIINSNPGFKEETFGERLKFLDLLNAKIAPEFVTQWNNQKTEL